MTLTLTCALLAAAAVLLLLWQLRGMFLLPVRLGRKQDLVLILRTADSEARLESTVRSLLWLVENGTLPASIVIEDAGLNAEARMTAQLLEKQYACIHYQASAEDKAWRNRNT